MSFFNNLNCREILFEYTRDSNFRSSNYREATVIIMSLSNNIFNKCDFFGFLIQSKHSRSIIFLISCLFKEHCILKNRFYLEKTAMILKHICAIVSYDQKTCSQHHCFHPYIQIHWKVYTEKVGVREHFTC